MAITRIKQITTNTHIAESILFTIIDCIESGASTYQLNQLAKREFKKHQALPSTKLFDYNGYISIAVNQEILFGQVSEKKKLKEGDIVKLALGVIKSGYASDIGFTLIVGKGSFPTHRLVKGTARALCMATQTLRAGTSVRVISSVIENTLKDNKLSPISEIMGHGVGRNMHEPPAIPNCTSLPFIDYSSKLQKDSIVCIEPIATTGSGQVVRKRKMSFITKDKKPSAHFEFPILIKQSGVEVLGKRIFKLISQM